VPIAQTCGIEGGLNLSQFCPESSHNVSNKLDALWYHL
jgi:hypothetical protein